MAGRPTRLREVFRRLAAGTVLCLAAGAGLGDDLRSAPDARLGARQVFLDLPYVGTTPVEIPRASPTGVVLLLQRGGTTAERRALVNAVPWHVLLVDVDTTLNAGKPEMSVNLDRPKAADLGVQIADAAEALRLLVAGDQVTTFNDGGEQYEVHLRAEEENRSSQDAIAGLPVPSSRLGIVSLDNIASFARGDSPATISRMGRQRQVTLTANMLPGTSQGAAQQAIADAARELNFSPEYRADFVGRSRELNRTATAFLTAIALSFIFMYLILAAQFESWLHPVTILLSLPLTLPFALLSALLAWRLNLRAGGAIRWQEIVGILLCMVFARSVAMAFNRLVDRSKN